MPSSRILALLLVVAAIITATVIIRADDGTPSQPVARLTGEQTNFNEKDTDGDGVKDWEEELWGLSAVTPDTDGDGVGDADEVKQDRELFGELPGDIFAQATENPDDITPIGLAGRVLISQFLTSKQSGVPYTESDVANAANLTVAAHPPERSYTTYTLSDITVSGAANAESLRAYGNAIGDALTNKSGTPAKHELSVLLSLSQSEDTEQFTKDMQEVLGRYDITINGFLGVTVPSDVAPLHLATINAMERVKTDLADMAALDTSPLISLSALGSYSDDAAAMAQQFEKLRTLFTQNNIVFSASEPGYAFMNAAQTTN